jgi:hypothetical protein
MRGGLGFLRRDTLKMQVERGFGGGVCASLLYIKVYEERIANNE